MVWFNEIKNGDDHFIAYGPEREFRPVFGVRESDHYKTTMKFPSCVRFMPYSEVSADQELDESEITKRFGEVFDGQTG